MKHESRGAGEGVGGIGGRSEEGSERLGRAEIVGIKGKGEEKGDIIAVMVMVVQLERHQLFAVVKGQFAH